MRMTEQFDNRGTVVCDVRSQQVTVDDILIHPPKSYIILVCAAAMPIRQMVLLGRTARLLNIMEVLLSIKTGLGRLQALYSSSIHSEKRFSIHSHAISIVRSTARLHLALGASHGSSRHSPCGRPFAHRRER